MWSFYGMVVHRKCLFGKCTSVWRPLTTVAQKETRCLHEQALFNFVEMTDDKTDDLL